MNLENPLLRRACLYLEDGAWDKADEYCEQVLDQEPENAYAYLIKLMAQLKVDKMEKLGEVDTPYEQWDSWQKAYRFADEALKQQLYAYSENVKERIRQAELLRKEEQERQRKADWERKQMLTYNAGLRLLRDNATISELKRAQQCFAQIPGYADSAERVAECKSRIAQLESEQQLQLYNAYEQEKRKRRKKRIVTAIALICLIAVGIWGLSRYKHSPEPLEETRPRGVCVRNGKEYYAVVLPEGEEIEDCFSLTGGGGSATFGTSGIVVYYSQERHGGWVLYMKGHTINKCECVYYLPKGFTKEDAVSISGTMALGLAEYMSWDNAKTYISWIR